MRPGERLMTDRELALWDAAYAAEFQSSHRPAYAAETADNAVLSLRLLREKDELVGWVTSEERQWSAYRE